MALETGFLCLEESLASLIRRMWWTQKPWELETSKQEKMSYLPLFVFQHDVFGGQTNAEKNVANCILLMRNILLSWFLCFCFYFGTLWPKTEEGALVAVNRQHMVILGCQLAIGKCEGLLLVHKLCVSVQAEISQKGWKRCALTIGQRNKEFLGFHKSTQILFHKLCKRAWREMSTRNLAMINSCFPLKSYANLLKCSVLECTSASLKIIIK